MNEAQFGALQVFVTVQEESQVQPAMMAFTAQLQLHPAGDQALNSVLSREQVDIAQEIMGDLQSRQSGAGGGGVPAPPAGPAPPSAPAPPIPPQPPAPGVPAGPESTHSSPPAPGSVVASPSEGGGGAAGAPGDPDPPDPEEELEELRALLAGVRGLAPAARTALEKYATVAQLAAVSDSDLLGIAGLGPVALRRLRDQLNGSS